MDNKSIRKHPIRALMFGYLTLWIQAHPIDAAGAIGHGVYHNVQLR